MLRPFGYVNAEYLRRAAAGMQEIKQASYERLLHGLAGNVLDAGCGPGIDTVAIAALVPPGTMVTGIDIDPEMISAADAHALENGVAARVTHTLADVYDLPFEDSSFGACRAERLFQNIPAEHDSKAILGELLRVLRPGGRIVLIDTDYGSSSLDFDDTAMERRMMTYCAEHLRPNGLIARQFFRMLSDAEVTGLEVTAHTLVFRTPEDSPFGEYLADAAVRDGMLGVDEARYWVTTLQERARNGTFFASLNVLIASGAK